MTQEHSRKLFVNLSVRDLGRAVGFFKQLGFEINPKFSNDQSACLVVNDHACVMLLVEDVFRTFTQQAICDTAKQTEGLFALSAESRDAVDAMLETALAAGGKVAMPPQDHGFMYGRSFYDPDGHHWEVFWMDPNAPMAQ